MTDLRLKTKPHDPSTMSVEPGSEAGRELFRQIVGDRDSCDMPSTRATDLARFFRQRGLTTACVGER